MQALLAIVGAYLATGAIVAASPLVRSAISGAFWPDAIMGAARWRVIVAMAGTHTAMIAAWPVLLPGAVAKVLWLDRIGLGTALRLALTSYRPHRRINWPITLWVGPGPDDVVVVPAPTEARLAKGKDSWPPAWRKGRANRAVRGSGGD